MDGRHHTPHVKPILSFSDVKDTSIDRTHFFKAQSKFIYSYFSKALNELYNGMWSAFAFDHVDMNDFKKAMLPVISSGAMIVMGDFATKKMSQYYNETEEYEFVYKFLLAFAILSYSALHRVTDKKIENTAGFTLAVSSEVMAITFLYYSTYQAAQFLLQDAISEDYSLISGLATSGLVVPGAMAYSARQVQNKLVKRDYAKGAQRSDTALISSGLTGVSNAFFQAHYRLLLEMNLSRMFQVVAIIHSILNNKKWIQKGKDVPSLGCDLIPPILNEILKQQERIDHDYKHNTAKHRIFRMTKNGPVFFTVPRYQLRNDDLVLCDDKVDLSSMPISGEVVALEPSPESLHALPAALSEKFLTNLIALTGENNWLQYKTSDLSNDQKEIDLHRIRDGKQAGVLVGSKLNLHNGKNFFIKIKPPKEFTASSSFQKKSVIADIITQHKKKTVISAVLLSVFMSGFLTRDITLLPGTSLRLLFTLFQMTIPFSEGLLTKFVTTQLMKKLNANLGDEPLDMISVLRLVDFCNALAGYYGNKEVDLVSDKTGTLTTAEMIVKGFWSPPEKPQTAESTFKSAKLFAWIYTNQEEEFEPEEASLKNHIAEELQDKDFLTIEEIRGNNHFIKKIKINNVEEKAETWHLGLFKSAGGRFTLVESEGKKYLTFCGIPGERVFKNMPLFDDYAKMPTRTGVLSRDWCTADAEIVDVKLFEQLKTAFEKDDKNAIEQIIFSNPELLQRFTHDRTYKIDNPLKEGAEKLISQFRNTIVATGDTAKAAKNIADILFPANAGRSIIIRNEDLPQWENKAFSPDNTVIFAGINDEMLALHKRILLTPPKDRPVVIYAEMSTEGKRKLVVFLKENDRFVAVNGDGTNDVGMMQEADVVFAHKTSKGTYAPGVEQYADLNDKQLQKLLGSNESFYKLFDAFKTDSQFVKLFAEIANSLEKASIGIILKSSKMNFEMVKAIGWPVKEIPYQHFIGLGWDILYFAILTKEITASTDRPMDNKHLGASDFPMKLQMATFAFAAFQAFGTYALTNGESTNVYVMASMLAVLPIVLKSVFSAFGHVQEAQEQKRVGCGHGLFDRGMSGPVERDQDLPEALRVRSAPFAG